MQVLDFDSDPATRFVETKRLIIGQFLERHPELKTGLDIGAGVGKFTHFLKEIGLSVTGIEGREENVRESRRRYPGINMVKGDIEGTGSLSALQETDIVFALGLFYHLKNLSLAASNLHNLTRTVLFIETTVLVNESRPIALLVDEPPAINQGLDSIAFIPSENCLVKILLAAGFSSVYRRKSSEKPTLARHRVIILASKRPFQDRAFEELLARPSPKPDPYPPLRTRVASILKKIGSKSFWLGWET